MRRFARVWPLVVGLALIAGAAVASIPDAAQVIHGCYNPKQANKLRVIDTAKGQKCSSVEKPLNWNQNGPPAASGSGATAFTTPLLLGRALPCGPMVEAQWADLQDENSLGDSSCAGSSETGTFQTTVAVDPSDFPSAASGSVTGVIQLADEGIVCLRMFDYTTALAVGTYACLSNDTPGSQPTLVFATPQAALGDLSSGIHRLGLQVKFHDNDPCECNVYGVRLTVNW
jgi:hypothetical protein